MKPLLLCAALLIGTAFAIDAPPMKEGLWSIHTQSTNNPGNKKDESTKSICRDHAYDAHAQELAKQAQAKCKKIHESSSGGVISTEMECPVGGSIIHTKGTATIMGENAARSETHANYTPPMFGISDTTMVMEQKYVGACPAGVQPGDFVGADGKVIHRRTR